MALPSNRCLRPIQLECDNINNKAILSLMCHGIIILWRLRSLSLQMFNYSSLYRDNDEKVSRILHFLNSWGCRICRLHFCRGVKYPLNECPGYDTPTSESEAPVIQELWGTRNIPSWPLLSDQVVAPICVPPMSQIELFNYLLYLKPLLLNIIIRVKYQYLKLFNCIQTGSCKNNVTHKLILYESYIFDIYV